jgi:acyl carrier protein
MGGPAWWAAAGEPEVCYISPFRQPRTGHTGMSVRSIVITAFEQVAREQQRTLVPLSDGLKLLESGLDSLSFAIIVAKLEDEVGFDPFNSDESVEFPITFGDFVQLYETRPR